MSKQPAKPDKPARPPARPARNVPATAEWIPEWKQWGEGARQEGKRTGAWTFWRGDGSLQEEAIFVEGQLHGDAVRYHPDGSVAAKQRWARGALADNHLFFTDEKTDEFTMELDARIRSCRALYDERDSEWVTSIQFFDGEGQRLTLAGEPAPPRPEGVPEHAYLSDEAEVFRVGKFRDGKHLGIHREWTLEGEPRSILYTNGDHYGRVNRFPDEGKDRSHPLVAATAAGDAAAVEDLFALGLGHEPGLAIQAALAGQLELARRIAGLPPGTAFASGKCPQRPEGLPDDALYAPGLDRWVHGSVDAERGPSAEIRAWKTYDDEIYNVEISSFEDGVLRLRRTHDGASEADALQEEEIFDERGQLVKKRHNEDYGTAFSEEETLPSGERVTRRGDGDRVLSERLLSAEGSPLRDLGFDERGRRRAEFDFAAMRGQIFDEEGELAGSGAIDEDGYADGAWTLASGAKVATGGLELQAGASTAKLLPLLARLAKEPVPALLKPAAQVPWTRLEGFFPMNEAAIPMFLRMIALDEPVAADFALDSMADAIYHQETITELSGPVMRFLVELVGHVQNPAVQLRLVDLLVDVLYRGRNLDAAHRIKKAYGARKGSSAKELARALRKANQEAAFGEIVHAVQSLRATLERLISGEDKKLALFAVLLIGFVEGKEAAATLGALLERPHERGPKAEPVAVTSAETVDDGEDEDGDDERVTAATLAEAAAYVLSLYPRAELPLPELRGAVAIGAPSLRREAALTLVRTGAEDDAAIEVVLQALRDGDQDAGVVMTLLPDATRHLSALVELVREASMVDVYGLARAALTLAWGEGSEGDEAFDDDDDDDGAEDSDDDGAEDAPELPQPLRDVLEALVANDGFWRLNSNAGEVLEDFGLPGSRAVLSALLRGENPEVEEGSQTLSSASGLDGSSVDSWRDLRAAKR